MKILDFGFVNVIDSMGDDLTVVNAARVSFHKKKVTFDEDDVKLMNYLAVHNHMSPFRHCIVQFHIKAPEFVARQFYKHIVGSDYAFKDTAWNEVSRRYTEYDTEAIHAPEKFRSQSKVAKQGSGVSLEGDSPGLIYKVAIDACITAYKRLLELGVAREQARLVLPFATYTEWYWTASLQAIAHLVKLRSSADAQTEIVQYANALTQATQEIFPVAWAALMKQGEKNG